MLSRLIFLVIVMCALFFGGGAGVGSAAQEGAAPRMAKDGSDPAEVVAGSNVVAGSTVAASSLADVDVERFRAAFNAASDHVRVVALLSPT